MSTTIKFLTVKVTPWPGSRRALLRQRLYEVLNSCNSTLFPVKLTVKTGASRPSDEKRPILLTRPPSDEEKWDLVRRVAASTPFQKATRLRDFLLYVSERTLKQDLDNIRESNIGLAVFGRAADYNPSEDNIVRVEARHLRKRLADYFANEGKDEPFVITIPKGSYVPIFVSRDTLGGEAEIPAPADAALEPETPPAGTPAVGKPGPAKFSLALLLRYGLVAALLIAVGLSVWLSLQNRQLQSQLAARRPIRPSFFPWTAVLNDRQTKIVLADSCWALLQDVTGRRFKLNEYVTRGYVNTIRQNAKDDAMRSVLDVIVGRQYTSLADVMFVSRIMQLTAGSQRDFVLTYARNLNIRDFKSDNVVLVGSPGANPWVELFEPKMNFLYSFDTTIQRPVFRNRSPQPGEAPVYMTSGADGRTNDSYAVVALLPNLNRTGNVLIIEGTNMEGTEAGVEYLTGPDVAKEMPAALAAKIAKPGSHPPYFEILLKLRTVGGTSESVEPIAYRLLNE